ncbi:MAG: glycosyltransferase family 2 protein [Planctomycetota bacterium]
MLVAQVVSSHPSALAWALAGVALAGLVTWGYLNFFAGLTRSLRYRLPAPDERTSTDHERREDSMPAVAIVAPGRNEADHLPRSLPDLCRQDYPGDLRVIFVDDASTDATPAVCRAALRSFPDRLEVVRNDVEPPAGWVGKTWAIHRGVRHLETQLEDADHRTPWLCFTDADLRWHPQLLRIAMDHAQRHDADVVAVAPTLVFGGAWETIVQLQLMVALAAMLPFEKAMDPAHRDIAICGGAFILVRRDTYDQVGGHEAVKGEIVEDLQLGLTLKRSGATMRIALADELQWCRMYDGVADMWEGLTKNAYAGLRREPAKALAPLKAGLLLIATLLLNIAPMPMALGALIWCVVSPSWIAGVTLAAALLATLLQARALNLTRRLARPIDPQQPHTLGNKPVPFRYAWTMPIGSAAYSVIMLASILHAHTRGNVWKGRAYKTA